MFYLVCAFHWHVITAEPLEQSRGEDGQSVLSLGWLRLTAWCWDYVTSWATNIEDNCQFCVIKSKENNTKKQKHEDMQKIEIIKWNKMTHIKTNTIQEFCFLCLRNPSWLMREFLVPIKAEGLFFFCGIWLLLVLEQKMPVLLQWYHLNNSYCCERGMRLTGTLCYLTERQHSMLGAGSPSAGAPDLDLIQSVPHWIILGKSVPHLSFFFHKVTRLC